MSTPVKNAATYKFFVWILPGLATAFSTMVFSRIDRIEKNVETLLVARGVDHNEIQNINRRLDGQSCIEYPIPTPPIGNRDIIIKEMIAYVNPNERNTRRKYMILN